MKTKYIYLILMLMFIGSFLSAQNQIALYPYQMQPSKHPDYTRYYVKSPDFSVFGNKIQFIGLRDLSGDYKRKLDLWVDKDKLGDILWVSYPLIYQDNLKEIVSEIKKRKLFLFDLWGYIPGSGPGGYWTQFQIPEGVLSLFETELGDHWLGMDNGEQDGRYVGSFAPRMYPLGADRLHQYFNFQRHFEEMGNQLGNKMATLVSLNFGHYFLKEGLYTLIGAETAQGLPNSQIYYSFIRGAGKQYGVNWFGNASVWNRWGYKTYDSDATNIEDDYNSGGPWKGTSLSLLKRLMYHHLMYDCVAVGFEGSMRIGNKLSPIGRIQQHAVRWNDKYGDPGIMYTPVALMVDFFSGWSFPRHLYSSQAYKVWGNLPYELSDYLTDGILNILYPGYQDASYYKDERGFITPTPYGDIADCIMSDAPSWILEQYPVLVIADELRKGQEINDKLNNYVRSGGHLIITAGSLQNMPDGIAGITAGLGMSKCTNRIQYRDKYIQESNEFSVLQLDYPSDAVILQKSGEQVIALERTCGKGKVTVMASPFGVMEIPQCALPIKVEEEKELGKPYPLLKHVSALLDDIFSSLELFDTNPELSLVTCSRSNKEYTVLVSNNQWKEIQFHIQSKSGKINSIKELPIDCFEKKSIGYTPKVVKNRKLGKNTSKTIAGGDVRIFRICLQDADVKVLPEKQPTEKAENRALVLHDVLNLKEEILSRPTFFHHYDRVVIDWRYLYNRDKEVLKHEAGWFKRQKLQISVDLTSGINLYPDLRIVNNDSVYYEKSMEIIKQIVDKMSIIGADQLLIPTQRTIENNYTMQQFYQSLKETYQMLADYAKDKSIDIVLKQSQGRTPISVKDLLNLCKDVDRMNFNFMPSVAMLLIDLDSLDENIQLLQAYDVKLLSLSAPEYDIHKQLYNINSPIHKSKWKEYIISVLSEFPSADFIFDCLYESKDEEYKDILLTKKYK